jgi:hypothetical protein
MAGSIRVDLIDPRAAPASCFLLRLPAPAPVFCSCSMHCSASMLFDGAARFCFRSSGVSIQNSACTTAHALLLLCPSSRGRCECSAMGAGKQRQKQNTKTRAPKIQSMSFHQEQTSSSSRTHVGPNVTSRNFESNMARRIHSPGLHAPKCCCPFLHLGHDWSHESPSKSGDSSSQRNRSTLLFPTDTAKMGVTH